MFFVEAIVAVVYQSCKTKENLRIIIVNLKTKLKILVADKSI